MEKEKLMDIIESATAWGVLGLVWAVAIFSKTLDPTTASIAEVVDMLCEVNKTVAMCNVGMVALLVFVGIDKVRIKIMKKRIEELEKKLEGKE